MYRFSKKLDNILVEKLLNACYEFNKEYEWFDDSRIETHFKNVNSNLLFDLTDDQIIQFNKGDGSELSDKGGKPAKMKSVFSSSALAVNAFSYLSNDSEYINMYDDTFCTVEFEKQLVTLYAKKGKNVSANIDVYLEGENTLVFIESKFAETYGGYHNNVLSDSYTKQNNKYDYNQYNIDLWYPLIKDVSEKFSKTRFDIQQNLKHLIGIYNFVQNNPDYLDYKIILLNF